MIGHSWPAGDLQGQEWPIMGPLSNEYQTMRVTLCLLMTVLFAGPGVADQDRLEAVIDAEHRSAPNKQRDRHRHPRETLEFFGIRPHMTVVEIWPSGGWYMEILAPPS